MNYTKAISKLLDEVKKAYIEDQESKGIRASGKSAKSIKKHVKPTEGTLTGAKYFFQQRHGRKPGRFPPIDSIIDWIRAKRITPGLYQPIAKVGRKIPNPVQLTERSLAFIIANKIAKQGTDIYSGKRKGLDPGEKVQTLVAAFSREVAKDLRKEIITSLK